jgi:hypothetical protein
MFGVRPGSGWPNVRISRKDRHLARSVEGFWEPLPAPVWSADGSHLRAASARAEELIAACE